MVHSAAGYSGGGRGGGRGGGARDVAGEHRGAQVAGVHRARPDLGGRTSRTRRQGIGYGLWHNGRLYSSVLISFR